MFGIQFETWKSICEMYFHLGDKTKASYLQWFPFTKLSEEEKEYLSGYDFFEKFIDSGSFVLFPSSMYCSENYILKSDGSFRDASLLSPILYLVLQAIGKEVSDKYVSQRNPLIEVYYAGNYENKQAKYKQDYDRFFKSINASIENYQCFIKTDLTNFFSSIDINRLIKKIDEVCNHDETAFTQTQLMLYKELLQYCGKGRFPLVENSVASSFLSTVVYLDEIDTLLYDYLENHEPTIDSFAMFRYVDDLYILISSKRPIAELTDAYNRILSQYSSILKKYGLSLNSRKCCIRPSFEINDELKKSLYDDFFEGEKHKIAELFQGKLEAFLGLVYKSICNGEFTREKYSELIDTCFCDSSIEFTPSEVFNYYVYEDDSESVSSSVIQILDKLVNKDLSFIRIDPRRLPILILKTDNSKAIKAMLSQLFQRDKNGLWNAYDTIAAISYLIHRDFRHIDLRDVLRKHAPELRDYSHDCLDCFVDRFKDNRFSWYVQVIGKDWKTCFLYFMYLMEKNSENTLTMFAYFKSFFDRFTADTAFLLKPESRKAPNYKGYYKKKQLTSFYTEVDNAETILSNAHTIRNNNPAAHSSASIVERNDTTQDINLCIKALSGLLESYRILHDTGYRPITLGGLL